MYINITSSCPCSCVQAWVMVTNFRFIKAETVHLTQNWKQMHKPKVRPMIVSPYCTLYIKDKKKNLHFVKIIFLQQTKTKMLTKHFHISMRKDNMIFFFFDVCVASLIAKCLEGVRQEQTSTQLCKPSVTARHQTNVILAACQDTSGGVMRGLTCVQHLLVQGPEWGNDKMSLKCCWVFNVMPPGWGQPDSLQFFIKWTLEECHQHFTNYVKKIKTVNKNLFSSQKSIKSQLRSI